MNRLTHFFVHYSRPAFVVVGLILYAAATAVAQVPNTLNYQGRLLQNTADQDAVVGTIDVVFSIWTDATGGTELWTEPWTGVALSNGIFSVLLGSNGSPLDPADFQADDTLFLQLEVDGETLLPRQQLGSAPFAMVDEPGNEIQDLELAGNTLSLSGDATSVDLSAYLDDTDTDQQDLSLAGNTLSLTNDPSAVDLSGYLDNTDAQTLSLAGNALTISGSGSSVDLSGASEVADLSSRLAAVEASLTRTVFVSSTSKLGKSIGGVTAADDFCQSLADAAGLEGRFLAWLSDSQTSPATRFDRFGVFELVTGERVADDWLDLTDGTIDTAITVDESGNTVDNPVNVWTGTHSDGTAAANHCGDWTASGDGQTGQRTRTDAGWTANDTNTSCGTGARLYCMEQVSAALDGQELSLSGNTLTLTSADGLDTLDLSVYLDDTDNQQLSLVGNSLQLTSDDGTDVVDLSALVADDQQLSLSGNSLQLTSDDGTDTVDLSSVSLTATSLPRPMYSNTILDNDSTDVGTATSVTLGVDGLGLISYADNANSSLKVAHCDDIACTSATKTALDASFAPDSTAITVGGNGLGLIGYCDGAEVKLARCDDLSCTSASTLSVDTGVCTSVSIALAYQDTGLIGDEEGRGILVYDLDGTLRTASCDDESCSSVTTTTLDTSGGGYNSIAVGPADRTLISYAGTTPASLKMAACSSQLCDAANLYTLVAADARYTSITTGQDGRGLISYYDADRDRLVVAHCDDEDCTTVTTTDLNEKRTYSSITVGPDGLGVIAAHQNGSSRRNLVVYHCSNVECTTSMEEHALSSVAEGYELSITIGVDGMPLIAHHRGEALNGGSLDSQLRVLHCSNAFCTPFARRR